MIGWLKARIQAWAHRVQQREVNRLLAENSRLKTELLDSSDGEPIQLTPAERKRLEKLRKDIDPTALPEFEQLGDSE